MQPAKFVTKPPGIIYSDYKVQFKLCLILTLLRAFTCVASSLQATDHCQKEREMNGRCVLQKTQSFRWLLMCFSSVSKQSNQELL